MSAISVNNVSKKFRIPHEKKTTLFQQAIGIIKRQTSYEEFWALRDISFDVERGETFGIIGRNGSGKSTLLKILARVMYPDSGSVRIDGRVASFLELGIGFQPELTARENVYIYASVLGMGKGQTEKVYDAIFDFAELKRFEDMKLKNFSSGMYIRLAFSTAIHTDPDIMLIDEVLAVGDEAFQKKCMERIYRFQAAGKTIIFVSHNTGQVKKLCRHSLLLHEGRIISAGDTGRVIENYSKIIGGKIALNDIYNNDNPTIRVDSSLVGGKSCCVTGTLPQPVPPGGPVAVRFNMTRWDTDGIHDSDVNNTRLTCRTPGIYAIYGCVEFDVNPRGRRALNVRVNGSRIIASQHVMAVSDPGIGTTVSISCIQYLNAGDYIELFARQGSGGTLNINAKPEYSPIFSLVRID
jgi:lipopolysaccharide transport system ATP-binding protein